MNINNKNLSEREKQIIANPALIQHMTNLTEEDLAMAVRADPEVIKYVEYPSEDLCEMAIYIDIRTLGMIKNLPEVLQYKYISKIIDLKQRWPGTFNVPKITDAVAIQALNKSWFSIEYMTDPSEEVQMHAISLERSAIFHMKKPHVKIQMKFLEQIKKTWTFDYQLESNMFRFVRNNKHLNPLFLNELLKTPGMPKLLIAEITHHPNYQTTAQILLQELQKS